LKKASEGDCEAWYFDYIKCLDKCVSAVEFYGFIIIYLTILSFQRVPQIFKTLK